MNRTASDRLLYDLNVSMSPTQSATERSMLYFRRWPVTKWSATLSPSSVQSLASSLWQNNLRYCPRRHCDRTIPGIFRYISCVAFYRNIFGYSPVFSTVASYRPLSEQSLVFFQSYCSQTCISKNNVSDNITRIESIFECIHLGMDNSFMLILNKPTVFHTQMNIINFRFNP
jgi:hypothetical protein